MTDENPAYGERLSVVETELRHTNKSLSNLANVMEECKTSNEEKFNELSGEVSELTGSVRTLESTISAKLRGSLSSKEKASIAVAIIAGLVSVINIIIQTWG